MLSSPSVFLPGGNSSHKSVLYPIKGMWFFSSWNSRAGKRYCVTVVVRMYVFYTSSERWAGHLSCFVFVSPNPPKTRAKWQCHPRLLWEFMWLEGLPVIIAVIVRARHKAAITVPTEWLTWPPHSVPRHEHYSIWPQFILSQGDNGTTVAVILGGLGKLKPHLHEDKMTWGHPAI